ncbi:RidA family protein [Gemmiger qucibialis]|uniref:RidA family protein n=1 Tax=Gemmiger qucibialis TaxID=2997294 RepID=UPI0022E4A02F|nr:RidA family protein [Gemmiger qucibialis]
MAVANHPLCEPVRFAHYKALVPIREVDGIVYVSGHGPEDINTYEPLYRGRVGTDLTLEDGYNAAAECAKTLLRAVQQRYGSLDCIHHLVRATALVNCGEGFTQPEKVWMAFPIPAWKFCRSAATTPAPLWAPTTCPTTISPLKLK